MLSILGLEAREGYRNSFTSYIFILSLLLTYSTFILLNLVTIQSTLFYHRISYFIFYTTVLISPN